MYIDSLMTMEWHEVLSAIEYLIHCNILDIEDINNLFIYHNIGYEVDKKLFGKRAKVVVKYDKLIEDNDKLINSEIKYEAVKESIRSAKKYLIDPKNIDIAILLSHLYWQ